MTKMRVITLQEPWASLIGEGIKTIETRSRPCRQLGEMYIHAGKTPIDSKDKVKLDRVSWLKGQLHYGTIFARCNVVDCVLITEEYARYVEEKYTKCYLCGDFTPGRYAWILDGIELIEPIPARGNLGIWYH